MARANAKGMLPNGRSSAGGTFTKALHAVFDHPDYIALSKQARALLWDLARQYNLKNNGNLTAALGTMSKWGWGKWELQRARRELEAHGWIEATRYPRAKREPILYRLTWLELNEWDGPPELDPEAYRQKVRSLKL